MSDRPNVTTATLDRLIALARSKMTPHQRMLSDRQAEIMQRAILGSPPKP